MVIPICPIPSVAENPEHITQNNVQPANNLMSTQVYQHALEQTKL